MKSAKQAPPVLEDFSEPERTTVDFSTENPPPSPPPPDASEEVTPRPALKLAPARPDLSDVPDRLVEAFAAPAASPPALGGQKRFELHDVGTVEAGPRLGRELLLALVFIVLVVAFAVQRQLGVVPKVKASTHPVILPPEPHRPVSFMDQSVKLAPPDPSWSQPHPNPSTARVDYPKRKSMAEGPEGKEPRSNVKRETTIKEEVREKPPKEARPETHNEARNEARNEPRHEVPPPAEQPAHARAAHAMISIVTKPAGATVEVDGKAMGKTPLVRPAPPGKSVFSIRIKAPKHKVWTGKLAPDAQGQFNLKVVLP